MPTNAYLLCWNPDRWQFDNIHEIIAEIQTQGHSDSRWSCGQIHKIVPGSRFFLIRLGVEPKGLVGSGTILSAPYPDTHWDGSGVATNYVKIHYDFLSENPIVSLTDLHTPPLAVQIWTPQSSGIRIKPEVMEYLEALWKQRTNLPGSVTPAAG